VPLDFSFTWPPSPPKEDDEPIGAQGWFIGAMVGGVLGGVALGIGAPMLLQVYRDGQAIAMVSPLPALPAPPGSMDLPPVRQALPPPEV
jgi:hypothetical protein